MDAVTVFAIGITYLVTSALWSIRRNRRYREHRRRLNGVIAEIEESNRKHGGKHGG